MIVKINAAAGVDFPGVNYNDKKVEKGTGELMSMKNFPEFINEESSKEDVKNYLAAISKSEKVKKPQFHAVISTKFREHSKEELTKVAENFMKEMGYENQPFIVVFHNDTENNHVHIVSTRVDKSNGKKINDSFEKLKSQKALAKVMENLYGKNHEETLDKLLNYKIESSRQLELLLERNGFKMLQNKHDENAFDILKNGVNIRTISGNQMVFDNKSNLARAKQIKAFLSKYKDSCSNKVFKVEDRRHLERMLPEEKQKEDFKPKIEFESELQDKMRKKFGIDIVFHHKEGQKPFGYSVIDNHTGKVFKGSEIIKMNEIFDFTNEVMDKKLFESVKDFNIKNEKTKNILLKFLNQKQKTNEIKEFMLFENNSRKRKDVFAEIRKDVKELIQNGKTKNEKAEIFKAEDGKFYVVHSENHFISELEELLGEKMYQSFLNPNTGLKKSNNNTNSNSKESIVHVLDILENLTKTTATSADPVENDLLRKKKRKRKK